jgi:uncharacterized protein YerC
MKNKVWVPTCSQQDVTAIHEMRTQGMTYAQIARNYGSCKTTVTRYHRLFERYGIEIFAKNKEVKRG